MLVQFAIKLTNKNIIGTEIVIRQENLFAFNSAHIQSIRSLRKPLFFSVSIRHNLNVTHKIIHKYLRHNAPVLLRSSLFSYQTPVSRNTSTKGLLASFYKSFLHCVDELNIVYEEILILLEKKPQLNTFFFGSGLPQTTFYM